MCGRRLTTLGQHLGVYVLIAETANQLSGNQLGITGGVYADLGQHLVSNGLYVLVVYVYSLGAVYFLNFVYQVSLHRLLALDVEQVLGVHRAVCELLPCLHPVIGADADMGAYGHGVFPCVLLIVFDGDLFALNGHLASHTGHDRLLGLGGDLLLGLLLRCLLLCFRWLCQRVAYLHPLALRYHHLPPFRHLVFVVELLGAYDGYLLTLVALVHLGDALYLRYNRLGLGRSGLKELLHPG